MLTPCSSSSVTRDESDNDIIVTGTRPSAMQSTSGEQRGCDCSGPADSMEGLSDQFAVQGIRFEKRVGLLWCAMCTTYRARHADLSSEPSDASGSPLSPPSFLVIVGSSLQDVLTHCATREHLLLYEEGRENGLREWCPVHLHGYHMLLDHHCIYPAMMFGAGRILMNETLAGGMLLGEDVCGGVKLWPRHVYSVVQLVLPSGDSHVQEVPQTAVGTGQLAARDYGMDVTTDSPKEGSGGSVFVFYDTNGPTAPASLFSTNVPNGARLLPHFCCEEAGVRSEKVRDTDIAKVLDLTCRSIEGEAVLRSQRRRSFAQNNY